MGNWTEKHFVKAKVLYKCKYKDSEFLENYYDLIKEFTLGVGKKTATFLPSLSWTEFHFLTSGFLFVRAGQGLPTCPHCLLPSCRLVAPPVRASFPPSVKGRLEPDDHLLDLRLDIFQVDTGDPACFSAS